MSCRQSPISLRDRMQGSLLGLATGDAVGTAVEFKPRGSFVPLVGMVGGGPFGLQAGQWTDDTSMALCLATSLVQCGGFDARDQMERYCRWHERGYLSSTGSCFDIGNTVRVALDRFRATGEPFSGSTHPHSAGNGCIMRLAPVALYYWPDESAVIHWAAESSRTTHAAEECIDACRLLAEVFCRCFRGLPKEEVLQPSGQGVSIQSVVRLARGEYYHHPESQIKGSGYVIDCLEAAVWCFANTGDFASAVLRASNLGDDADTTAAVCGQIAGAYYGASGIPSPWLEKLTMRREIEALADQLHAPNSRPARGEGIR
jgi:ADP-ribosyl-[dinitrogen reductase] hydrolase